MANRKEPANRAVAASCQLPKTVGALAGDDSADIADSGCAGSGTGRDVMERQRTGGAKAAPRRRKQFLTLFPGRSRL